MRAESGLMEKDAPRTPTNFREMEKHVRNLNINSSPSLKHAKVTKLRKMFEPGLTDRDALTTTSPPRNKSENKSSIIHLIVQTNGKQLGRLVLGRLQELA